MARERMFAPASERYSERQLSAPAAAEPARAVRNRPLESALRAEMELGFRQPLGDVRVHEDAEAEQATQRLGAPAYTYGRDLYFQPGAYQPEQPAGRWLLAHELAHAIQQRPPTPNAAPSNGNGDQAGAEPPVRLSTEAAEREADAAADAILAGQPARVTPGSVPPQIQAVLIEVDGNDDVFYNFRMGPALAGNIAEAPVIRNYVRVRGEDGVYQGPVHTGNLPLASFFAATETDRVVIAGILRANRRPDVVDTRSKEVWDIKPRGQTRSSAVIQEYIDDLQALYDEYWRYTPRSFDVRRPTYLDAPYDRGRGYPPTLVMLRPFLWIVAEEEAPGVVGYWFVVDDEVYNIALGDILLDERNEALGENPLRDRPMVQPRAPRLPRPAPPPTPAPAPPPTPPKKARKAKATTKVTHSPRATEYELRGDEQPGDTLKATATKDTRGVIPGLEFGRASLLLGPDLQPIGGAVTAVAKLPFARDRSIELTFSVDETGHSVIGFESVLRLGSLADVPIQARMENDLLTARATVIPKPAFLQNVRGELLYQEGELSGNLTFTPDGLTLPIPGLTAENVSGMVTFTTSSVAGEGAFTLRYQGLGQADIAVRYDRKGLDVDGVLNVTIPGLEPVTGTVGYQAGKLTAETRLTKDHFPDGLPLESGAITIRLVDGVIEGSGKLGVSLGPVGRGSLTFGYSRGAVEIGAEVNLDVPGLRGGAVQIRYADGKLEGQGSVPLDTDLLPGLGGNLEVWYREGRFGAETTVSYRRGELAGGVTVRLEQLEDGALAISGGGEVSARITPWLTGQVQVEITRDAAVNIRGEVKAPDEIELFPRKAIKREKTFPRIEFPLFGITVPVVGSIGIIAFVEAGGGFELFVGPGVLRNITVRGAFGIDGNPATGAAPPSGEAAGGAIGPSFDISGQFAMSAGAEAYLFVEGGISLDAAVADILGSIRLRGGLGAVATLGVTPHIGYENGDYYFKGDAELAALAFLRLSGEARAAVSVALYGEVWGESWPLFEWVYPLGLNVGMKGRMAYYFGRPFEPSFEIQTEELDPLAIVKGAFTGGSSTPAAGPSTPPEPLASMTSEMVPGASSAGGPVGAASMAPVGDGLGVLPGGLPGSPAPPTPQPPALPPTLSPVAEPPAGASEPPDLPLPPPPPSNLPQLPAPPELPDLPGLLEPAAASEPPGSDLPPPPPPSNTPPANLPLPPPPSPPSNAPPVNLPPPPGSPASAIRRFEIIPMAPQVEEQPLIARAGGKHNHIGAPFQMQVDFDPASPHVPDLEYRQLVSGRFAHSTKGSPLLVPIDHPLPDGSKLAVGKLVPDGVNGYSYGDRKRYSARGPDDEYLDEFDNEDRANGAYYRGSDNPGVDVDANDDLVEVNLEFVGQVVHRPTSAVLDERRWTVFGLHQNP